VAVREDIYWNTFLPAFFSRVSDINRKAITAALEPYGLTHAHGIYLMALTLRDGQTMVSLSQFLDMDSSNTNRVIKKLKEKNLVYDDRDSPSSKKYKIYLTEEGRLIGLFLMDHQTECMNQYFKGITNEEIISMRNTLLKLLNNMDPELESYMLCKYQDPFYTYLHVDMGKSAPYHVVNREKTKDEVVEPEDNQTSE
jgi:DNA-binding MarR family transcriptional regulator